MADVGGGCAPVVAGKRPDRVVAAAEHDNVAVRRDGGIVERCWEHVYGGSRRTVIQAVTVMYIVHLNVVGHGIEGRGRGGGGEGVALEDA